MLIIHNCYLTNCLWEPGGSFTKDVIDFSFTSLNSVFNFTFLIGWIQSHGFAKWCWTSQLTLISLKLMLVKHPLNKDLDTIIQVFGLTDYFFKGSNKFWRLIINRLFFSVNTRKMLGVSTFDTFELNPSSYPRYEVRKHLNFFLFC